MDVTPPTATADVPDPVTAAVADNPKPLGLGLLALGLVGLVLGVYLAYLAATAGKPPAVEGDGEAVGRLVNPSHVAGAVAGLLVALVGLGTGVMAVARVPADTPEARRTEARTLILTAGGLLGLVLMIAGGFFLYLTFDVLTTWLDSKSPPKDAWKPVASLLGVLAGAGLAFLAAQPARAEERNNPFLRRLVYGGNLALTALLLLLALVVGNVLAGLKVPNKLDTTEGGFYSLSDATKAYLAELDRPIKLYTTIPEGGDRLDADTRTLLDAMREANPRQVTVVPLSPTLNRREIADLRNRFPQADLTDYGVLITTGEDEKAAAFLRESDFLEGGGGQFGGRGSAPSFTAESKIVKELLFLTESKTKPVVYALTGHGELEVAADPAAGQDAVGVRRTASRVRTAIEKVNAEVRPLALTGSAPKVPDDAAVVLILDPRSPIPEAEAGALKAYMTKPAVGGKPGKLFLAAGPQPKPDRSGVAPTGLEDLLAGLGVRLGTEYILNQPLQQLGYTEVLAAPSARLIQAKNPVASEFVSRTLVLPNCREVVATPTPPGAPPTGPTAELFLGSYPPSRITWLEAAPPANPGKLFEDLLNDPEAQQRKRASQSRSRSVAALVSQDNSGRAAVVGSGEAFADPAGRGDRPADDAADLVAVTVNWLRDRPAVANIAAKDYRTYTLDRKASDVALVWLPVGATLFGVLALGLGVWVFRRK